MTEYFLSKEFHDRLHREVLKDAVELIVELGEAMLDRNRMAPTDVALSPEETVRVVAEDARSGLLGRLRDIAPKEADRVIREAGRAVERLEHGADQ